MIHATRSYTDTAVTDNQKGLLNARRLAEYTYALPRTRWNVGIDQRIGRVQLLGRLSYYGSWYDYDSGFGEVFIPSAGIDQGFFDGRPIIDVGSQHRAPRGHDARRRSPERVGHLSASQRTRRLGRREVQRVHTLGIQRSVFLHAHRLHLEPVTLQSHNS